MPYTISMLKYEVNYASAVPKYALPMATMGDRIRGLREGRGLTQDQMGEIVGISGAAISQWESGATRNFRPENFLRFCAYFRVDPFWVVWGDEQGSNIPKNPLLRRQGSS